MCRQEFAIVKVMDCRDRDYLKEVSKYVVEGSELAKWPADQLNEFVRAVRGRRFFFAFGSLFHDSPEIRRALNAERRPSPVCDCGCSDFRFEDEQDAVLNEILGLGKHKSKARVAPQPRAAISRDGISRNAAQGCLAEILTSKTSDVGQIPLYGDSHRR
jgi:hypothetical protein